MKAHRIAALMLFGAILTIAIVAVARNSPVDQTTHAETHTDYASTQSARSLAFPTNVNRVKSSAPSAKKQESEAGKDPPEADWWTRISAVVAAFATVALAVIGWIAACFAKKTLRWLGVQTRANARAAQAALFGAQAVINAERAWIVVSVESPEPNEFNFRATNVGKTPAKIKSIWSSPITFWRDSELEIPPDEKTGESLLSTPPCLLPPTDSQIVLRCDIGKLGPGQYVGPDASARVQNDIQKGFRSLYFYGRIIYSDTLDDKSIHETKWLYWYLPVGERAQAIPDPRHPELNSYS